jgi:quinol monooxygenase YgiN
MAVYKLVRYAIRADARLDAERAMHAFASYVRAELADSSWTAFRDPARPTHFLSTTRDEHAAADELRRSSPGHQAFVAAITPLLDGGIEEMELELVTSSDLAPRHKPGAKPGRRRRPR